MLALLLTALLQAPLGGNHAGALDSPDRPVSSPEAALARELAQAGPAAIPELLARLAADGAEAEEGRETLEEALVAALASFGADALRPTLRSALEAKPDASVRQAALRVLARVGTSADFALVRLAMEEAGPGLEGVLQETCTRLLARDARALEPTRRWLLQASPELGPALARAIADSAAPQALEALTRTLGYRPELDALLLPEIGRLVARAPMPLDDELLVPLEAALEEEDPRVLREAALVLGRARHAAAVPRLIALLEHEARGVRNAAECALERVTGLRFRADPRRWAAWLARETDWYAANGERLRRELGRGDAVIAIRALGELCSHPWRAHEFAAAAGLALANEDPRVRRLACLTLARLGSTAAGGGLLQALEDEDESVVQAAHEALERLGLGPPAAPSPEEQAIRSAGSRNPMERPRSGPKRS